MIPRSARNSCQNATYNIPYCTGKRRKQDNSFVDALCLNKEEDWAVTPEMHLIVDLLD